MGIIPKAVICLFFVGLVSGIGPSDSGRKLTVCSIKSEPFMMESREGGETFEGFHKDIIDELSKRLDFDYDLRLVKDGMYGRLNTTSNKWSGLVGELVNHECDVAVGDLTMTAEREKAIDFSFPILNPKLVVVHRVRQHLTPEHVNLIKNEDFFTMLRPMSSLVWMGFIIVVLLFAGLILLVETRMIKRTEKEMHGKSIIKLKYPKSIGGRFMSLMFVVWLVLWVAIYMSSLTAQRMTKLNMRNNIMGSGVRFNTLEEVFNDPKMKIGYVGTGATSLFFKNSKIPLYNLVHRKVLEWQTFTKNVNEGIMRVLEDRNANFAFIMESSNADYIVRKHCDLYIVPEKFGPSRGFGIALKKNDPLVSKINVEILNMKEEARIEILYNKWWKSTTPCRRMNINMEIDTRMPERIRDDLMMDKMNMDRMDKVVDRELIMENCTECHLQVTMREMSCMYLFAACCMILGVMISVMDFRRTK